MPSLKTINSQPEIQIRTPQQKPKDRMQRLQKMMKDRQDPRLGNTLPDISPKTTQKKLLPPPLKGLLKQPSPFRYGDSPDHLMSMYKGRNPEFSGKGTPDYKKKGVTFNENVVVK